MKRLIVPPLPAASRPSNSSAARRPVVGADKVAKAIICIFRLGQKLPDVRIETAVYNSAPAVVVYSGDHLEGVFLVEVTDGKNKQSQTINVTIGHDDGNGNGSGSGSGSGGGGGGGDDGGGDHSGCGTGRAPRA